MVCGKTTWAGCGAHVEQVRAMVPAERWCACSAEQKAQAGGGGVLDAIKRAFGGR
jgi:hypothetical protein